MVAQLTWMKSAIPLKNIAAQVEFEDKRHIDIITKLVQQVYQAGALIKEKEGLIKQMEKFCSTLKNRSMKVNPSITEQCNI